MLEKLKHLLKHSFVYSISNAAIKASGIILLPIYTTYFSPEEYGRMGLLMTTVIIFSQTIVLGQGLSVIRFNNSKEYRDRNKSIFFTITLVMVGIAALFVIAGELSLDFISNLFDRPELYAHYIEICIYIIAAIALNNIFLSKLRADDNSVFYTVAGLIKLAVMMSLAIYFVVIVETGIEGVFYAQLACEISTILVVLPKMIKEFKPKIEVDVIWESFRFGIPLIFSAVAMNLLNGSDRYIIKYLAGEYALGLYELGYRVAGVLYMFVIMPFSLTLLPAAYKIYKQEGDKRYYSKIKTYLALFLLWAGLFIAVYSKEIIMLFARRPEYYSAYTLVPIIVFSYVFYGMSMISSLGMYLSGKMRYIAVITLVAAGLNIALNFWLIPIFGITGAAFNTLIAFFLLDYLSYLASEKYYSIPYENFKILKITIIAVLLYLAASLLNDIGLVMRLPLKLAIVISFPFIISLVKFYEPVELQRLKGSLKKWRDPKSWKENFLGELTKFRTDKENKD